MRVIPAPKPQEPATAEVLIDTRDKKFRLIGPTSWAIENDVTSARDALTPVALEMARLVGCGLRIDYVDTEEFDELSKEEVLVYGTSFVSSAASTD